MFTSVYLWCFRTFLLLAFLGMLAAGCTIGQPLATMPTSAPTPVVSEPAISVPLPVEPGEQIGVSIRVDSVAGMDIAYEWIPSEGTGTILQGQGTNAITYQAPAEPGTYSIRAKVTTADAVIERSTFITVHEVETPRAMSADTPTAASTLIPTILTPTASSITAEAPTPISTKQVSPENDAGPVREHQTVAIGSGPLMTATFSDGLAPYTETELGANYYRIQRIRLQENPDGCDTSIYDTNKVWFGSGVRTSITVNDVPIAELKVATGKHGYIFDWPIRVGDKICVTDPHPAGFAIVFGPDMFYHYDSYCYRGQC